MKKSLLLLLLVSPFFLLAQNTYPPNGTSENSLKSVLYINAHITVAWNQTIPNGALLIEDGLVKGIYDKPPVLRNVAIIDLKGAHIYPGFIDLYSSYGLPKSGRESRNKAPQFLSDKVGAYSWNEAVHPEYNASAEFSPDTKQAEELRKMGFGFLLSHQADGIFQGTGALVNNSTSLENTALLLPYAATFYSLYKGHSSQDYPRSQMGSIALIRQTMYDAEWYIRQSSERNLSLEAFNQTASLPKIFEARDPLELFRIYKIAEEFDLHFTVKVSGYEYRWIDDLEPLKDRLTLIVPLTFDKAPKQENPLLSDLISTTQLYDYFYSPYNPKLLLEKGFEICITAEGLKKSEDFFNALRTMKESGLSETQILKALLHTPAAVLRKPELGKITIGAKANFFVCDGSIFDPDSRIMKSVVFKEQYSNSGLIDPSFLGAYAIWLNGDSLRFEISRPLDKPKISHGKGSKVKLLGMEHSNSINLDISGQRFQIINSGSSLIASNTSGLYTLYPTVSQDTSSKSSPNSTLSAPPFDYAMEYAYANRDSNSYAIKNVTIWTCEEEGNIEGGTVIILNGKIAKYGRDIKIPNGIRIIDGTGMHLSPGIIDEHSHIAIYRGVNEGTQAVTSEVRIGDVLNSQDINIYRQLAGGVTTSHLLHGSANPIGGQTELIKLRYGMAPEALKFDPNFKFIKFALGENVKQTNWGDHQRIRYPQTRMGVEQIYVDAFTRAISYRLVPPDQRRRDLELDALVEILESKRFITCHSYQQGEINMLMHVADSFGFTVNTFTHVLEGYKVADKIRDHGASASTFADWWAYKYEVIDAIPYNASILYRMSVNTAINSDDAEMGRRLNQEAAKAMKYGGLTEIEALKLITINPARMLHIAHRVGSIATGKDADLVLWTANPLSIYARVHTTFIDGVIYYNITMDQMAFLEIQNRRNVMLEQAATKKQEAPPKAEENKLYHCDDEEDETY